MRQTIRIIFQLFARSAQIQKKRAYLTIAAIAWGTVSILLLLAFGEGLKLQLNKNRRAMGENIAVLWPGETTKAWRGLPPGHCTTHTPSLRVGTTSFAPTCSASGRCTT